MNEWKRFSVSVGIAMGLAATISGCSPGHPARTNSSSANGVANGIANQTANQTTQTAHDQTTSQAGTGNGSSVGNATPASGNNGISSDHAAHPDGTIISLTPIQVPHTTGLKTYRMMYWSDNVQTEAFLAVPQQSGTYPLLVNCHGGLVLPSSYTTHYPSPMDQSDLQYANPQFITLIPEYRGYAGSEGTVQGLHGDTLDTNNAIQAVMSRYSVKPGHVYLQGASMGGGVVLQLAAERHDIRSVIALSPYVGMSVVGQWAVKNKDNSDLAFNFYGDMLTYGTDNPNSPLLSQDSVDYKKITVPVLLLQGTADQHVPWQTVQTFYNDLKPFDSKTKLILFPGGHHGLHGQNQSKVRVDIRAWYQLYGEYGTAEN